MRMNSNLALLAVVVIKTVVHHLDGQEILIRNQARSN
jgi:hypothetical protein